MQRRNWIAGASLAVVVIMMAGPVLAQKHELVYAKDGSGVFGYKDTPIQPWSGSRS